MIQRDYEYIAGDAYPHKVTIREYFLGFKMKERVVVGEEIVEGGSVYWYNFPSMTFALHDTAELDGIVRQERYAHGV